MYEKQGSVRTVGLAVIAGLGLLAGAVLAQSSSSSGGSSMGSSGSSMGSSLGSGSSTLGGSGSLDSGLGTGTGPGLSGSLSGSSSGYGSGATSGSSALDTRLDGGLLDTNSSITGSIYKDGSLFGPRDVANMNQIRYPVVNQLASPYANGNANASDR